MKLEIDQSEYLPLRELVFKALRKAIIKGELAPGERLMEEKLAKKLEVSRTPVREAIRMLELEGLVVMIPRRGAEVAKITIQDLKDALEVRMAIEDLSVRLACERINEDEKETLKLRQKAFEDAAVKKVVMEMVECDEKFHDIIFEATKNKRLISIAHSLREQVYRYRFEYIKDFSYHEKLINEHRAITEAILAGNVDAAKNMMKTHIFDQEQIIISNISKEVEKEYE
ncbi:MAG: GntR family transcriptional regulator [Eubacterium sp.]|nr:GntR family transcriptional regulator [Eubacterium sp.]